MLIIFVVGAFSSQQHQLSDDMGESSPVSEDSGGFVDGEKKQGKREENGEHGVRGIFRKALQDLSVRQFRFCWWKEQDKKMKKMGKW